MTLRPLEWANMQKKLHSKDFQAITLGWGTSPDIDFYQLWHSTQADIPKGSNYVGFRNAEADKIIEAMELEFDLAKEPMKMTWKENAPPLILWGLVALTGLLESGWI